MEDPLFVEEPYKIGSEQVHDGHDAHLHTGDQIDLVDHEQDQDVEQHKADFEPECRREFLQLVPSYDVLIAVIEQHDQELAHSEQHSLVSVDICRVWILNADPHPVTEYKTDLEHHNIKDNEVDVLEPASQFFFMHKTLLAAVIKERQIKM